jgi:hypothetical protein
MSWMSWMNRINSVKPIPELNTQQQVRNLAEKTPPDPIRTRVQPLTSERSPKVLFQAPDASHTHEFHWPESKRVAEV